MLPAQARAVEPYARPSSEQLRRLQELEPYVRYFTSLSYGPQRARVSGEFIRALILIESGANTEARSAMGARGVTQILPSTAREVLRELAGTRDFLFVDEEVFHSFHPELLKDPAINILIACYLAATYHDMYDGRTDLVVAAWNAGPGAVARFGNKPPPYRETLKLIKRVEHTMDYLGSVQLN
jgi:soluble lytic murein transglycosylase-like protein